MEPLLIMLADDHAEMRQEMKRILAERKDYQVIEEAEDGLEVLNLLSVHPIHPHLLILDLTMPHLSGIEVARKIKTDYPEVKILILTIHQEEEYLDQAITAGVQGYLLKKDADAEIFFAIEKILNGEFYFSPLLRKQHNAQNLPSPLFPKEGNSSLL